MATRPSLGLQVEGRRCPHRWDCPRAPRRQRRSSCPRMSQAAEHPPLSARAAPLPELQVRRESQCVTLRERIILTESDLRMSACTSTRAAARVEGTYYHIARRLPRKKERIITPDRNYREPRPGLWAQLPCTPCAMFKIPPIKIQKRLLFVGGS